MASVKELGVPSVDGLCIDSTAQHSRRLRPVGRQSRWTNFGRNHSSPGSSSTSHGRPHAASSSCCCCCYCYCCSCERRRRARGRECCRPRRSRNPAANTCRESEAPAQGAGPAAAE